MTLELPNDASPLRLRGVRALIPAWGSSGGVVLRELDAFPREFGPARLTDINPLTTSESTLADGRRNDCPQVAVAEATRPDLAERTASSGHRSGVAPTPPLDVAADRRSRVSFVKLTPGHVIAYLLGISGNVWAAFVSDLPDKVRGWVEATLLAIPLIVIGSWAYPDMPGLGDRAG